MKFNQIDRDVMRQFHWMQVEINTFNGYRHMWADMVNHRQFSLTRDELEQAQIDRLGTIIGMAKWLADHFGMTWSEIQKPERPDRPVQPE